MVPVCWFAKLEEVYGVRLSVRYLDMSSMADWVLGKLTSSPISRFKLHNRMKWSISFMSRRLFTQIIFILNGLGLHKGHPL